jgi:hypothetical protein
VDNFSHANRPGIDLLIHAHDYLWANSKVTMEDRLLSCNLLYACAADLLQDRAFELSR